MSPVGAGLWEETMRWRGRSQLPLWDKHKAAIRGDSVSVQAGKSPAMDAWLCRGWGRNSLPALCPCTQLPFDWHSKGGRSPRDRHWQYLWVQGAGVLLHSAGTRCLGCLVLARQWHGHTRPPSLGQPSSCFLNQLIKYQCPQGKQVA